MTKLKPCPFCGGEAEVKKSMFGNNQGYALIACKSCGASSKDFKLSLDYCAVEEAAKAWNRRVERSEDA